MVTLNECCILLVFLIRCDLREPSCETENLAVKFCMLTSESTSTVLFAGFGKQISLGVFGTDFGSDVMTIYLQLSKSERKVSCFWQSKTT
jgi:hypothetical protein